MIKKYITENEIENLTKLSKITLSETEKEIFLIKLNDSINQYAKLKELNTEGVPATFHLEDSTQHFHEDIVKPSLPQNVVIGMTKYNENGYFRVPGILP